MSGVDGDGAGRVLDGCGACGECHDPAPPQQPDQTGLVVAREPPVAWRRRVRDIVQTKQVGRLPAEGGGLLAPPGKEAAAVFDCLLPVIEANVVRALPLQGGKGPSIGARSRPSWCLAPGETRQRDTPDLLSRICISHETVPSQSGSPGVSL